MRLLLQIYAYFLIEQNSILSLVMQHGQKYISGYQLQNQSGEISYFVAISSKSVRKNKYIC